MTARQVPNQVPTQVPREFSRELCRFGHACSGKDFIPSHPHFCNRFHEKKNLCAFGPNCGIQFRFNPQNPCKFSHDFNASPAKPQFEREMERERLPEQKSKHENFEVKKPTELQQRIAQQEVENDRLKLKKLELERDQLNEEIRRLQQKQIRKAGDSEHRDR